jgi:hypothetical protein
MHDTAPLIPTPLVRSNLFCENNLRLVLPFIPTL